MSYTAIPAKVPTAVDSIPFPPLELLSTYVVLYTRVVVVVVVDGFVVVDVVDVERGVLVVVPPYDGFDVVGFVPVVLYDFVDVDVGVVTVGVERELVEYDELRDEEYDEDELLDDEDELLDELPRASTIVAVLRSTMKKSASIAFSLIEIKVIEILAGLLMWLCWYCYCWARCFMMSEVRIDSVCTDIVVIPTITLWACDDKFL